MDHAVQNHIPKLLELFDKESQEILTKPVTKSDLPCEPTGTAAFYPNNSANDEFIVAYKDKSMAEKKCKQCVFAVENAFGPGSDTIYVVSQAVMFNPGVAFDRIDVPKPIIERATKNSGKKNMDQTFIACTIDLQSKELLYYYDQNGHDLQKSRVIQLKSKFKKPASSNLRKMSLISPIDKQTSQQFAQNVHGVAMSDSDGELSNCDMTVSVEGSSEAPHRIEDNKKQNELEPMRMPMQNNIPSNSIIHINNNSNNNNNNRYNGTDSFIPPKNKDTAPHFDHNFMPMNMPNFGVAPPLLPNLPNLSSNMIPDTPKKQQSILPTQKTTCIANRVKRHVHGRRKEKKQKSKSKSKSKQNKIRLFAGKTFIGFGFPMKTKQNDKYTRTGLINIVEKHGGVWIKSLRSKVESMTFAS